jgi:hypothetical protein
MDLAEEEVLALLQRLHAVVELLRTGHELPGEERLGRGDLLRVVRRDRDVVLHARILVVEGDRERRVRRRRELLLVEAADRGALRRGERDRRPLRRSRLTLAAADRERDAGQQHAGAKDADDRHQQRPVRHALARGGERQDRDDRDGHQQCGRRRGVRLDVEQHARERPEHDPDERQEPDDDQQRHEEALALRRLRWLRLGQLRLGALLVNGRVLVAHRPTPARTDASTSRSAVASQPSRTSRSCHRKKITAM